jgi:hypothetical protein
MADAKRMWFELSPTLGESKSHFLRFCRQIERLVNVHDGRITSEDLRRLRAQTALRPVRPQGIAEIKLHVVENVILDLIAQGWLIRTDSKSVKIHAPLLRHDSPLDEKERIRRAHLLERDAQLGKRPVIEFVKNMETSRLTERGWHSIFSVMRDGPSLSTALAKVAALSDREARADALEGIISPYIQIVEGDAVCRHTSLRLRDIWRYFRLTWVNNYKSVPGRSIMVLIRDAAYRHHPVVGIAALGSSVVQQKVRDEHIGWDASTFVQKFRRQPSAQVVIRLHRALSNLIDGVYIDDLLDDSNLELERIHLSRPTHSIIERLRRESKSAREMHQLSPHASVHKSDAAEDGDNVQWEERAHTQLFRSKRCLHLATLLSIRKIFQEHNFTTGRRKPYLEALESDQVRVAIGQLVRLIKSEHVGIDMLDITVCGAIAPYNAILGGKLVCMLLCSPEIVRYYATKYCRRPSIIASSMKGGPVRRPHRLVLLCTTSLYGVGSSQYNRIKVPAKVLGGSASEVLEYKKLGCSVGFGSFHFSEQTLQWIKFLLGRKGNRKVNSIFGEGVNPLMRKIREALDFVGLPGDEILWHGNKRVIYAVPLAANYREVLLGFERQATYLVPQTEPKLRTSLLANYWRRRWLASRITSTGVLARVSEHTLAHPICHGARVSPSIPIFENGLLWDMEETYQA